MFRVFAFSALVLVSACAVDGSTDDTPGIDLRNPRRTRADSGTPVADSGSSPVISALEDGFEDYPLDSIWPDGSRQGPWMSAYRGYGTVSVEHDGTQVLAQRPLASTNLGETHAALVLSDLSIQGDFRFAVRARTVRQLRTPTPNAWEVAWVVWHYENEGQFYYFVPKPNGWELGKVDNSRIDPAGPECLWPSYENCVYPGAQRYLATGSAPTFPVGPWYAIVVEQRGGAITVTVDDRAVVTFTDLDNPYDSGSIGLYNEDAYVHFDDVLVTLP